MGSSDGKLNFATFSITCAGYRTGRERSTSFTDRANPDRRGACTPKKVAEYVGRSCAADINRYLLIRDARKAIQRSLH